MSVQSSNSAEFSDMKDNAGQSAENGFAFDSPGALMLFEHARIAMAVIDESDNIVAANAACCALFKASFERLQRIGLREACTSATTSSNFEVCAHEASTPKLVVLHPTLGTTVSAYETRTSIGSFSLGHAYRLVQWEVALPKAASQPGCLSSDHPIEKETLRNLSAHQDFIKEKERQRIAMEIHDELGSTLTGVKSCLSFLIEINRLSGRESDEHLVEANRLLDTGMATVRRIIADLRPSLLDQVGLWAAIEWYAKQVEKRTGLKCDFAIDSSLSNVQEPEGAKSIAIFRIVQEALTNVVRHAQATRVSIWGTVQKEIISIEIVDDGKGISDLATIGGTSWGILGMRERAGYFGGALTIGANPGCGTTITFCMPVGEMCEK